VEAEKYVIAMKTDSKPVQQYIFQYKHAPLFMDRFEALMKLLAQKGDQQARQTIMEALTDKNPALRQISLEFTENLPAAERALVYDKIRDLALKDPVSLVRAASVRALSKAYSEKDNSDIFAKTGKDKAPSVKDATLEALK
jgi:aminopeptidase N